MQAVSQIVKPWVACGHKLDEVCIVDVNGLPLTLWDMHVSAEMDESIVTKGNLLFENTIVILLKNIIFQIIIK